MIEYSLTPSGPQSHSALHRDPWEAVDLMTSMLDDGMTLQTRVFSARGDDDTVVIFWTTNAKGSVESVYEYTFTARPTSAELDDEYELRCAAGGVIARSGETRVRTLM